MASAITFITQRSRQEEILLFPQGSRSLHRGLQRPKGANKGALMKRKVVEICKKKEILVGPGTTIRTDTELLRRTKTHAPSSTECNKGVKTYAIHLL